MKYIAGSLFAIAFLAALAGSGNLAQESKTGGKKVNQRNQEPFYIFNPDTMARPTAGYSHVAEVTGGRFFVLSGLSQCTVLLALGFVFTQSLSPCSLRVSAPLW